MDKQTGILLYSGKLGNQVGYYRKNKKGKKEWWTRRAPESVRQTAAMDIIAVLPAPKPQKAIRIYSNKPPRLHIIPTYVQPVNRYHHKQHIPLHPLKE